MGKPYGTFATDEAARVRVYPHGYGETLAHSY